TVTLVAAASPWTVTLSQNTTALIPIANGISFSYYPPSTTVTGVTATGLTLSNNASGTFSASGAIFRLISTRYDSTSANNAVGSGTAFPRPGAPGVNYFLDWTPTTPWNDACTGTTLSCAGASPTLVFGGAPITWATTHATASSSGNVSCSPTGTDNADVWFRVTKPTGVSSFNVITATNSCSPVTGTSVEVFSGSCGALTSVGCNTNASGNFGVVNVTGADPCVQATYYIRVTGDGNTSGKFQISVVNNASAGSTCATANVIPSLPFSANCLTTSGMINDYSSNGCNAGYAGEDLVYTYTPTNNECVTLTTTGGTGTNGGIFVFSGCPSSGNCVGYGTSLSANATATVNLVAGTTYYFIIDAQAGTLSNFTFSVTTSGAAGAANDEPANATLLNLSPLGCQNIASSNLCASATVGCGANIATTSCGSYNSNPDVWFRVTVPGTGVLTINTSTSAVGPTIFDPVMAVYTGTCGSFTEVACNDNSTGLFPSITVASLIPGSTVYVRVWSKTGTAAGNFNICVQTCSPPSGDQCAGATAASNVLTPGGACISSTTFCANPTPTTTSPNPSCGMPVGNDVWFTATVPANGNIAIAVTAGATAPAMTDGAMAIYTGSCGALTEVACSAGAPFPTISLTGQTPGTVYYIRVWADNGSANGSFQICATSSCNALDECTSAGVLPWSPGATPTYYTFSNTCATTSTNTPLASCVGTVAKDIWITLTVPPGATQLTITALTGTMPDPVLQVYTGTCNALTQFACNDDGGPGLAPEVNLCNVTGGQTLYLRIFPWAGGTDGAFQIAAFDPGFSVANPYQADNPCEITQNFPVTFGACSNYTYMSLRCYTPTTITNFPGIPNPFQCWPLGGGAFGSDGWNPSNDLWVRVIVPPGVTGMNFLTQAGTEGDDNMAVYRVTSPCTNSTSTGQLSLTQLGCDDLNGPGLMPYLSLGGLIPGETLYVRHYPWNGGTIRQGDFYFCVEAACTTSVPNDDPCVALNIPVNSGCIYNGPYTTSCSSVSQQAGLLNPTCGGFTVAGTGMTRDVWFTATVPPSGQVTIDVQSVNIADAAMAVYTAANCTTGTAFTQIGCDDNSSANPTMPYLSLTGLTPGATLYIRIWGRNGGTGQFNICATDPCPLGPPPNDDPCNAIQMTAGVTYTGYNSCATATNDPATYPACFTLGNANTVWYRFTAPSTSVNITTTLGSLTNTQIALYQGSFCFSLIQFGTWCNDNYS
ncbi:MAG: hypothetical protein ACKOQ6_07765, partial [Bacteroidota bacterium]